MSSTGNSEATPDPWGLPDQSPNADQPCFQDNFVDKLPDSAEYLDKLESKLNKLQKKSSIAKELSLRRSDEARRMLDANAASIELFEDADIENSAVSRRLFPEKQALTMSEIAKLLESDVLAKNSEYTEEKSADNSKSAE